MITRGQILDYFRSEKMEDLKIYDRFEIMVLCCVNEEMEDTILQAIDKYNEG